MTFWPRKGHALLTMAGFLGGSFSLFGQERPTYLSVMRIDGRAFPIAEYRDPKWSMVWPEPVDVWAEEPAAPEVDAVPATWLRYSLGESIQRIRFHELVLDTMYCCQNWGYSTDWPGQVPGRTGLPKPVNALLFSDNADIIPAETVPQAQELRERFGLIDNPVEGESFREFVPLGYFRLHGRIFAVFLHLGWEGESYNIYEYEDREWTKVLTVGGGGC